MIAAKVSDEAMAAYIPLCDYLAKRYDGLHSAEYDDLFQEGWECVMYALYIDARPSQDIVAKYMLRWVNKCARHGVSHEKPVEDVHG